MLHSRLLFFIVIVSCLEAANHYCIQESTKAFSMNADSDQTETLLTSHGDLQAHVPRQSCSWEVSLSRMTKPLQLVLRLRRGRLWQEAANGTACPSELSVALQGSGFRREWRDGSSLPTAPLIVPVQQSSQQLIVRFSSGDLQPEAVCGRIELSIGIAKKGFCGRNMLLHRHRCLFVSDESLQLSDLNGTGAELAGISGVEQLRELQADNDRRAAEYPFIKPLDLTSAPMRVGVFSCDSSDTLVFGNYSSGSCKLRQFNSTGFDLAGGKSVSVRGQPTAKFRCGALRVASSGKFILELHSCEIEMRSLLSFSEVPSSAQKSIVAYCDLLCSPRNPVSNESASDKTWKAVTYFLFALSLLAFLVLL